MNLPTRLAAVIVTTTTATLAIAGVAGAKAGEQTFQQTFPAASPLCVKVAQGGGPARLRPSAAQVLADCSTLQNGFNAALATLLAGRTSIASVRAAERTATSIACTRRPVHPVLCLRDRRTDRRMSDVLERRRLRNVHAYYGSIEADRVAFWTAIRALPGGKDLHEDAPIPVRSV